MDTAVCSLFCNRLQSYINDSLIVKPINEHLQKSLGNTVIIPAKRMREDLTHHPMPKGCGISDLFRNRTENIGRINEGGRERKDENSFFSCNSEKESFSCKTFAALHLKEYGNRQICIQSNRFGITGFGSSS